MGDDELDLWDTEAAGGLVDTASLVDDQHMHSGRRQDTSADTDIYLSICPTVVGNRTQAPTLTSICLSVPQW